MRFYSGFSLREEAPFFDAFLDRGAYCVAGFSYGAIRAAEAVQGASERVDRLQLFSPAFFQNRDARFKRMQLMGFSRDPEGYAARFLAGCFEPYALRPVERDSATEADLRRLLEYVWEPEMLEAIAARGTRIEVYLGGEDRIVDAAAAREFFLPFATVTTIKKANHFLQES